MVEKSTMDWADYNAISTNPAYISFGRSFLHAMRRRMTAATDEAKNLQDILDIFLTDETYEEYAALFGYVASNGHRYTVLGDASMAIKRHDVRGECGALRDLSDDLPPGAARAEFRRAMSKILKMCKRPQVQAALHDPVVCLSEAEPLSSSR